MSNKSSSRFLIIASAMLCISTAASQTLNNAASADKRASLSNPLLDPAPGVPSIFCFRIMHALALQRIPTELQLQQNYPNPFSQIPRFAGNPIRFFPIFRKAE